MFACSNVLLTGIGAESRNAANHRSGRAADADNTSRRNLEIVRNVLGRLTRELDARTILCR